MNFFFLSSLVFLLFLTLPQPGDCLCDGRWLRMLLSVLFSCNCPRVQFFLSSCLFVRAIKGRQRRERNVAQEKLGLEV